MQLESRVMTELQMKKLKIGDVVHSKARYSYLVAQVIKAEGRNRPVLVRCFRMGNHQIYEPGFPPAFKKEKQ